MDTGVEGVLVGAWVCGWEVGLGAWVVGVVVGALPKLLEKPSSKL